jgi:hypothetical protein
MKTIFAIISIMLIGLAGAQTVRDDSAEQYFAGEVRALCGPRAEIYMGPHSATIVLSGEYLEDRNLNATARNLALAGLYAYPDGGYYFSVSIQDSKGSGYAEVHR